MYRSTRSSSVSPAPEVVELPDGLRPRGGDLVEPLRHRDDVAVGAERLEPDELEGQPQPADPLLHRQGRRQPPGVPLGERLPEDGVELAGGELADDDEPPVAEELVVLLERDAAAERRQVADLVGVGHRDVGHPDVPAAVRALGRRLVGPGAAGRGLGGGLGGGRRGLRGGRRGSIKRF
jgi:hypothetical protein